MLQLPKQTAMETPENPIPPNNQPTPTPAPPESAVVVIKGAKSESEIALEVKLAKVEAKKREVETRVSELEDENHRLKQIPTVKPTQAKEKTSWLNAWGN